jgi:antitoxin component of RelBE/YafQ-DinJ toxin-antitoxin module
MKEKLTLTIEKETKKRAKKHAKVLGRSVSDMVEEFLNKTAAESEDYFTPTPGSAAYELANLIPESEKVDDYDYKKMKGEMLEERYGNK